MTNSEAFVETLAARRHTGPPEEIPNGEFGAMNIEMKVKNPDRKHQGSVLHCEKHR